MADLAARYYLGRQAEAIDELREGLQRHLVETKAVQGVELDALLVALVHLAAAAAQLQGLADQDTADAG